MTAKHPMIPFPVIVRAADGDIEAINQIVRHYSGFIASRSMRPMKDEYGNTHMVVDETLRRRMETRLIAKILSFEIRELSNADALYNVARLKTAIIGKMITRKINTVFAKFVLYHLFMYPPHFKLFLPCILHPTQLSDISALSD